VFSQCAISDPGVQSSFTVINNYVTEKEEEELMKEVDTSFKRRKYQYSHWDGVITGYRETEKANWSHPVCQSVIDRLHGNANDSPVHVLDLASDGFIRPHIDSVKFCGDTISSISLLSDSIMKLTHHINKDKWILALLPRYSLYIMKGLVRYEYAHEILPDHLSNFNGHHIPRSRRVSIISRTKL
jgi:alkylated DNA repair protein alkB family protein 7